MPSDFLKFITGKDAYDDEENVKEELTFGIDEDVYEKVGVKKPRHDETLDGLEAEKVYKFQLQRDIEKINDFNGPYQDKVKEHNDARMENPVYRVFAQPKTIGTNCRVHEVSHMCREISWRSTSTLTKEVDGSHLLLPPIIANKRYQEWVSGKPAGPSKEFLVDKAQRKQDQELWENIKFARLEKTRTELREEAKKRSIERAAARLKEIERLKNLNKKDNEDSDEAQQALMMQKKRNILANKFELNRVLPTREQHMKSMTDWDKGHVGNWDFGKEAFGKYVALLTDTGGFRMSHSMMKEGDVSIYEGLIFSSDNYIKEGDDIQNEFISYTVETNLKKAEYFLSVQKLVRKKEAKAAARAKAKEEAGRRRTGNTDAAQLAIDAIMAKTAINVQGTSGISGGDQNEKKNKKKKNADGEEVEEEESDSDSDSDSERPSVITLTTTEPTRQKEGFGTNANGNNDVIEECDENNDKEKPLMMTPEDFAEKQKPAEILPPTKTQILVKNVKACYKSTKRAAKVIYVRSGRLSAKIQLLSTDEDARLRWKKKMKKKYLQCGCFTAKKKKKVLPELQESSDDHGLGEHPDDFQEVAIAEEKKLREWEKYTQDEIDKMDVYDRKRLKKMRKKDEEEDERQEQLRQRKVLQDRVDNARKEKEGGRANKRTLFGFMHKQIKRFFFGKKVLYSDLSSVDRRKKEAADAAAKMLKDEENQEAVIEALITFRERQRVAQEFVNTIKNIFGLGDNITNDEFSVDDLIRNARLGKYMEVIDMVDHIVNPIDPNATNADGESAFFVVLMMVLKKESADDATDLEVRTCMQTISAWFNNAASSSKLDMVLKILYHKGGNVNFVKNDRDVDGTSVLHEAASIGGIGMIGWLYNHKANFDIRTTQLNRTPLMLACRHNQMNAVMYLLKKGSMLSLNATDKNGWTALHFAAAFADPDLANVLLICGAHSLARSERGTQAVDEAATRGRTAMAEMIRTFKSADLLFRQQFNFLEIKYLSKEREEVPDVIEENDDDNEDEDVGEAGGGEEKEG